MPTGKQNTFANRTLPCTVYVAARRDQPVNLVGAFEQPVQADRLGGYEESSCKRLDAYAQKVYENYADSPVEAWVMGFEMQDTEKVSMPKLLEKVETFLISKASEG